MTLLVVNADDFGLTEGVSRAIVRAHREGIVTSTSALALGSGFARSSAMLADHPGLGVGAHLAAVGEDPPLLSAREVPTLVDRQGRLHRSWRSFLPLAATGRVDPADLRREFDAQLDRIADAGITIDHLDTHQNLHLWPVVRDVLFELGEQRGVRATRVTRSAARGPIGSVVRRLARTLVRRCDQMGWTYPRASTGLDGAGHLDTPRMVAALEALARQHAPSAELATHPGEFGDPDLSRYRWGYLWGAEGDALCSRAVRSTVEELGFDLGSFADLARPRAR
jgi:predicted glycoside hydrolase/deacetylase ChbG (UPF0249 family)